MMEPIAYYNLLHFTTHELALSGGKGVLSARRWCARWDFLTNGRACAFLLISLRASLTARSRCEWDNVWELTQFPMQQIQIDWSHAELLRVPRSHEVITPKKWALIERKQTKPANFFVSNCFDIQGSAPQNQYQLKDWLRSFILLIYKWECATSK